MKSFCRGFSFGILYRYLPYISTVYLTDIVLNQVLFQDNNNPIILCPVSLYQAELLLRDWLWHKQDNAADIISEMLGCCRREHSGTQWEPRWPGHTCTSSHLRSPFTGDTSHLPPTSHITLLWHAGLEIINYILYSKSALWKSKNESLSLLLEDIM